jgi:hypothetical protein
MAGTREARTKRIVNFYLRHKSNGKNLLQIILFLKENHFQAFIKLFKDMKTWNS